MILPARDETCSEAATSEMLAGVYIRVEAEEDLTVRPYQPPQMPVHSTANGAERPTVEQLAGVYVHVAAREDLTARHRSDKSV
jgi:hypothetical protein